MKKILKIALISVGVIVLLLVAAGFFGKRFFDSTFLDFESEYVEKTDFQKLMKDGYTFLDRNGNGELDIYEDDRQALEKRVANALSLMTMDEKIHLLKGSGIASAMGQTEPGEGIPGAVGTIVPTPRLGLPTIYLSDGPAGLRILPEREGEDKTYYCTAFPIATLVASTWNETLAQQIGTAMGTEALEYGIDVILGPGANIHRHPLCGRNFEYFSEDPVLSGNMGASIINGIESKGIGTAVKHYVANNQETDRNLNDVIVSERAMREIYLKGFEIIVNKSQPWTIMSSYNKVNGTYTSQSKYLLTDVLRGEWGFEGLVMTDWFGGVDAVAQIAAGNDLLEPGTKRQWDALIEGQESGALSEADINTSVSRILSLILKSQKMKGYEYSNDPDLKAHAAITRQSASEGMVLLKNDGTLPLRDVKNVALIGSTSYDFIAGGTGSGDVNEAYSISLEEGLQNASIDFKSSSEHPEASINTGFVINEKAKQAFEDFKAANAEAFVKPEGMEAIFTPFIAPEMSLTDEQLSEIVSTADVGIITIGRNAGEGGDRREVDDFLLSDVEQELIEKTCNAFHAAGKKVVVVMNIGGVIETSSWKDKPDAILLAWQGGQEGGNSVADILSGSVNPSGKLPMTFPVNLDDHAANKNFPLDGEIITLGQLFSGLILGTKERPEEERLRNKDYTYYDEGVYVGYRHFDKEGLEVSYPFGYGLSYTEFDYSDAAVSLENDTIKISVSITNVGELAGKEVVQVYAQKNNTSIDRPDLELKTFAKTAILPAGEGETLTMNVPASELSYWDEEKATWLLEPGKYNILIGSSSRDIRQVGEIEL